MFWIMNRSFLQPRFKLPKWWKDLYNVYCNFSIQMSVLSVYCRFVVEVKFIYLFFFLRRGVFHKYLKIFSPVWKYFPDNFWKYLPLRLLFVNTNCDITQVKMQNELSFAFFFYTKVQCPTNFKWTSKVHLQLCFLCLTTLTYQNKQVLLQCMELAKIPVDSQFPLYLHFWCLDTFVQKILP